MEVQELMQPRIKVIAPMPFMKNEVDSYLDWREYKGEYSFIIDTEGVNHHFSYESFKKWSHIFKDCAWWEDRNIEDMPKYVKNSVTGKVRKVESYCIKDYMRVVYTESKSRELGFMQLSVTIPATEQEWLSQNNK